MSPLRTLKLATPCSMIWERMEGNDRVRHCQRVIAALGLTSLNEPGTQGQSQRTRHVQGRKMGEVVNRNERSSY